MESRDWGFSALFSPFQQVLPRSPQSLSLSLPFPGLVGPPADVAKGRKRVGCIGMVTRRFSRHYIRFPSVRAGLSGCSPEESRLTSAWTPGAPILWDAFLQATGWLVLESGRKVRKTRQHRPLTTLLLQVAGELSASSGAAFPALGFGGRETPHLRAEPPPSLPSRAAPGSSTSRIWLGLGVGCFSNPSP